MGGVWTMDAQGGAISHLSVSDSPRSVLSTLPLGICLRQGPPIARFSTKERGSTARKFLAGLVPVLYPRAPPMARVPTRPFPSSGSAIWVHCEYVQPQLYSHAPPSRATPHGLARGALRSGRRRPGHRPDHGRRHGRGALPDLAHVRPRLSPSSVGNPDD